MNLQKQIASLAQFYWPQEQTRLVLWLPVLMAAGILAYFAMEQEPHTLTLAIWPAVAGLALFSVAKRRRGALVWLAFVVAFSSFVWTKIYTDLHHTEMLREKTRITNVEGTVRNAEVLDKGQRVLLTDLSIPELESAPSSVRLNIRGKPQEISAGDRVQLRAGLMPPSGAVMEGGFDFARYFYFREIGAVGFGLPPLTILSHKPDTHWKTQVNEMRHAVSARLRDELGGRTGAVAAALMTGDRAAIPKDVTEAMRITNLSHVLAISGMHMALVTGLVFISLRVGLVWLPLTRHNPHIKKWAAFAALLAGACYLVLSGFPISAVRAFVMVALLLGAVLLDREVMPMRSLAWAAILLLIYNPANVLEPGFQLSFMATMGLIAWYERVRERIENRDETPRFHQRVITYMGAILLTTLVAELVTTPLVIYHFNNASFYGMLANLVVMPIVAFVIMPSIVIAFLLWWTPLLPFILKITGYGIDAMIITATYVSELPYAQQFLPSPPGWAIALATLGLCWICLMRTRWRFWGLVPIIIAALPLLFHRTPDFFIGHDRAQIALRIDGQLQIVKGRGSSFSSRQWANGVGEVSFPVYPKKQRECDGVGCFYQSGDKRVGVFEDYKIVPKGYCPKVDIILATFYWNGACDAPITLDRNNSEADGAHWGWWDGAIRTTNDVDGTRPWSRYR